MTDIAIINDSHFGIKNDAQYMLDYQEKFYKHIFFPYLIQNNIKTVFHLGDLFDRRKYVNFVTLNRTKEMFLNVLRDLDIKMYLIPGNHDVYHKNSNRVNSLSELVSHYPNITLIEEPQDVTVDNKAYAFIPWINHENYADTINYIQSTKAKILCGHLELMNFEMSAGVNNTHGMDAAIFKKFKHVWTGHFHHKSSKDNIHYLGSQMEFTFADSGDSRGFHVYNPKKDSLTFIKNTYTMYEKLYYNDDAPEAQEYYRTLDVSQYEGKTVKLFVVKKTKPAIFEYFVDNLYKQNLIDFTIMEDYSEFSENQVQFEIADQSTKDLMDMYVDSVETDMNKNKLKSILNSLHVEAMHETR